MADKERLLDILSSKGLISSEQIQNVKDEIKRKGVSVEKALEILGYIRKEDIISVIAESMKVPYVDLKNYLIDADIIKLVPEDLARKHKIIPIFRVGETLTMAMVDPGDIVTLDEIRVRTNINMIEPVLSTEDAIMKAIDQYYGSAGDLADVIKGMAKMQIPTLEDADVSKSLAKAAQEGPVVKLVNNMITQAVKDRASDIHIEPDENIVRTRFRIDGILHEISTMPKSVHSVIVSRIKILSKIDIAETRKPQDGRIELRVRNKSIDLRVSTFPTIHGENVVMRILDKSSVVLGLADLGFLEKDLRDFDKLIRLPYGIILVTGPTGSGKSTTLYSSLATINSLEKNIITVEDPVEYQIPLIRQTQVNPKAGLTFATGLRSILRQDPDIVMVGEIRDRETADIAIQASLTGHLVFSTLHTNDAPGALTRLVDMGIEPFLVSSSLVGVIAQRLVRVICKECKDKHTPPDGLLKSLNIKEGSTYYKGKGCDSCNKSGYTGRIGIFEFLRMSEDIRRLVVNKASADQIREKGLAEGMNTLREDGLEKAKRGITTLEEVLRVTAGEE